MQPGLLKLMKSIHQAILRRLTWHWQVNPECVDNTWPAAVGPAGLLRQIFAIGPGRDAATIVVIAKGPDEVLVTALGTRPFKHE